MIYNLVCCISCKEEKSVKGIFSHFNISHTEAGKEKSDKARKTGNANFIKQCNNRKNNQIIDYGKNPSTCKNCTTPLEYTTRKNKFCSKSCATSYNNHHRAKPTKTSKILECISCRQMCPASSHSTSVLCNTCRTTKPAFSKIYINNCAHCNSIVEIINKNKKYCNKCNHRYSDNGRVPYYFKFNVFDFPNLFDLGMIKQYGYFSNGKNNSKININGVSRDHKVSVNEAIRNGYDPFYISHPLNCEILLHKDNNKKNSKSSTEYTTLCKMVDEFEMVRKVGLEPTKSSV
jgi:hypothetical protein